MAAVRRGRMHAAPSTAPETAGGLPPVQEKPSRTPVKTTAEPHRRTDVIAGPMACHSRPLVNGRFLAVLSQLIAKQLHHWSLTVGGIAGQELSKCPASIGIALATNYFISCRENAIRECFSV